MQLPMQDALAKANATVDDLHGVEIIGGGVRVLKIQEMLRDFFAAGRTNKSDPLELGLHLNGDEAPAGRRVPRRQRLDELPRAQGRHARLRQRTRSACA